MSEDDPGSPCISVCVLDEQDICMGCYRSGDEITDWFALSASQKREILLLSSERMKASNTVKLS